MRADCDEIVNAVHPFPSHPIADWEEFAETIKTYTLQNNVKFQVRSSQTTVLYNKYVEFIVLCLLCVTRLLFCCFVAHKTNHYRRSFDGHTRFPAALMAFRRVLVRKATATVRLVTVDVALGSPQL
jgi:hypothetical protein